MKKQVLIFLFGLFLIGLIGITIAEECTDSDGGLNYYLKGDVVTPDGNVSDSCGAGPLNTGNQLLEWRFNETEGEGSCNLDEEYYDCPNGCKDGACVIDTKNLMDNILSIKLDPNTNNVHFSFSKIASACLQIKNSAGNYFSLNSAAYSYSCANSALLSGYITEMDVPLSSFTKVIEVGKYYQICNADTTGNYQCSRLIKVDRQDDNCKYDDANGNNIGNVYSSNKDVCYKKWDDFGFSRPNSKVYYNNLLIRTYGGSNELDCNGDSDCPIVTCVQGSDCRGYICKRGKCMLEGNEVIEKFHCPPGFYLLNNVPSNDSSFICRSLERDYSLTYVCTIFGCVAVDGKTSSENVTCKFENSNKNEKCYYGVRGDVDGFSCEGSGSCLINTHAYSGEKITWKSTCGGYQYTIQDGNDETIYFKCNEGESNISELRGRGFRYAKWQCYGGFENQAGDENSCYSSDSFHRKAKEDCSTHCDNGKCGMNSFSVGGDCYFDEINYGRNETLDELNNTVDDFKVDLFCKDSCALEGKCYPITFRKAGKYCGGEGSFQIQLGGEESCENNFECESNICAGGKCLSQGLFEKIMSWFKNLFG